MKRLFAALALLGACGLAIADEGHDKVRLATGELLTGAIIQRSADGLTLRHPILGDIHLTPEQGTEEIPPQPMAGAAAAEAPITTTTPAQVTPSPDEPEVDVEPPSFWKGWKRHLEAGLSGASGNTENFNARGGISTARKTDTLETTADISYIFRTEEGNRTKSRGEANVRNDWLFKESPWGFYALGKAEYDEFQDWSWRLSTSVGPSYTFIKTDRALLRARAGLGASYEIGGDDEGITPEALFGLDAERSIGKSSKFVGSTEFLPSLDNVGEYRLNTKLGFETKLDANMSLKMGIEHRYDSDAGDDIKSSDVEYFILLGWDF